VDGALCAAATALANIIEPGHPPAIPVLSFAASHFGVFAPVPVILSATSVGHDSQSIAKSFEETLFESLHKGRFNKIGVGERRDAERRILVILLQGLHLSLKPVPRAQLSRGEVAIEGKLHKPFSKPSLYLTKPDGKAIALKSKIDKRSYSAHFRCAQDGVYRVEVMGVARKGPEVLANFPIWCGESPPRSIEPQRIKTSTSDEDPERRLFELINEARSTAGLKPVVWDEAAAKVARAHSQDMRKHDFVAHLSPRTGSPSDRVERAGLKAGTVIENVGRSPTVERIHKGLMNSPGHRAAILSSSSNVGVGVARRGAKRGSAASLFATELFLSPAQVLDPKGSIDQIHEIMKRRRPKLQHDKALDHAASSLLHQVNKGRLKPKQLSKALLKMLKAKKVRGYKSMRIFFGQGAKPEELAEDPSILDQRVKGYGAAVLKVKEGLLGLLLTGRK